VRKPLLDFSGIALSMVGVAPGQSGACFEDFIMVPLPRPTIRMSDIAL
jgi:hypothetical protein